jgi:hypothetical protein
MSSQRTHFKKVGASVRVKSSTSVANVGSYARSRVKGLPFHRSQHGMDQTSHPSRPIALITEPVGMHGSDGRRFGARVPLGRHFPLSRDIRGFFHPMPTMGRRGVDGRHFSAPRLRDRGRSCGGRAGIAVVIERGSSTGPRHAPFGPGTRGGAQVVEREATRSAQP